MKRYRCARSVGIAAAFIAATGPIHTSASADDKKHELEITANCLSREAPAFFADAGSPEKAVEWNADRTKAEITIKHGATVLATYRVVETPKSIEVSSTDHKFPDEAANERHSAMVSRCLFEAGYDNVLIDKKD